MLTGLKLSCCSGELLCSLTDRQKHHGETTENEEDNEEYMRLHEEYMRIHEDNEEYMRLHEDNEDNEEYMRIMRNT